MRKWEVTDESQATTPEFAVDEEPAGRAVILREAIGEAILRETELRQNLNQAVLRYRDELFACAQLLREIIERKEALCDGLVAALQADLSQPEALDAAQRQATEAKLQAVERIQRALDLVFERHRVERFSPSGKHDPDNATVQETVPGTGLEPGTIVKVLRPGYRWRGEMLRPADVAVAE